MQKYHNHLIVSFLYCNGFVIYYDYVKFASDARLYTKLLDNLKKNMIKYHGGFIWKEVLYYGKVVSCMQGDVLLCYHFSR